MLYSTPTVPSGKFERSHFFRAGLVQALSALAGMYNAPASFEQFPSGYLRRFLFTEGRHGFHSNITYNDSHSHISFYESSFKGPAYNKTCQEMCSWVRKPNLYSYACWHRRGERGPRWNVKRLQEDIACVMPSSLSQWESSSEDGTSSTFQAVKSERSPTTAVCHWALPCISQLSPGSLSSLACLLCALRGNSCPQLTWCWGWHVGWTHRQKASRGRIMSNAPRSLCFSPEALWRAPQNWG